jgi:outer membrane receptor protein involved in Fe transport
MYVVDGVILGRRDDGTIDPEAAGRALARIDPHTIASIQVLKGESAVRRFGPAASDGVILFDMISHAWRAKAGDP